MRFERLSLVTSLPFMFKCLRTPVGRGAAVSCLDNCTPTRRSNDGRLGPADRGSAARKLQTVQPPLGRNQKVVSERAASGATAPPIHRAQRPRPNRETAVRARRGYQQSRSQVLSNAY